MEKRKWFAGVTAVIAGFALFLTLFTYGGAASYSYLFGEEHFSENREIGTVEVDGMSTSEAKSHIRDQADSWLADSEIALRWFDERLELDEETVAVDEEETVQRALSDESENAGLVIRIQESSLVEEGGMFTGLADFSAQVNTEALTARLEDELSAMPAETEISVHEHMTAEAAPEATVLARTERQTNLDGEASEWLGELGEITIEADSIYSFREMFNEQGITFSSEENAAVLSSAVFETLVQSNFDITERHIRYERYDSVPLGYDAAVSASSKDLQAENVNDSSYTLHFESTADGFAVELEGYDWPYAVEVETDTEEQVDYNTQVRFDEQLPAGTDESLKEGKEGEFIRLTRSFIDETNESIREETISEDFYAPQHALEARSTEVIDETAAEDEPEDQTGYPEAEDGQPLPEDNGQPAETETDRETGEMNGQPGPGDETDNGRPAPDSPAEDGELGPDNDADRAPLNQNGTDNELDYPAEENPVNDESAPFQSDGSELNEADERPLKGR